LVELVDIIWEQGILKEQRSGIRIKFMSVKSKIQIVGVMAFTLTPILGLMNCTCGLNMEEPGDLAVEGDCSCCCENIAAKATCCQSENGEVCEGSNGAVNINCYKSSCACDTNPVIPVIIIRQCQKTIWFLDGTPLLILPFDMGAKAGSSNNVCCNSYPSDENSKHLMNCVFRC